MIRRKGMNNLVAAIIPTYAVSRGPVRTPASRNVRVAEDNSRFSSAPDPIRSSDWTGVGRDSGRSFRQIAVFFNIADIQSQSQDDFAFGPGTVAYEHLPYTPKGQQVPFAERVNVQRPSNVTYGSLLQMEAANPPYEGEVSYLAY